ncbi:hypothetical protein KIN20_003531 [Parelaphostrongylus tenuis]|uniref:Secreted protein n=1 Tax=Parelaphostrongylus tenuis TaxID=148309 RepID=A0AAD5LXF8_PARTN|nr:hypothetical protein KIN20_003531 [Parelaphostrongylus tenuis]
MVVIQISFTCLLDFLICHALLNNCDKWSMCGYNYQILLALIETCGAGFDGGPARSWKAPLFRPLVH